MSKWTDVGFPHLRMADIFDVANVLSDAMEDREIENNESGVSPYLMPRLARMATKDDVITYMNAIDGAFNSFGTSRLPYITPESTPDAYQYIINKPNVLDSACAYIGEEVINPIKFNKILFREWFLQRYRILNNLCRFFINGGDDNRGVVVSGATQSQTKNMEGYNTINAAIDGVIAAEFNPIVFHHEFGDSINSWLTARCAKANGESGYCSRLNYASLPAIHCLDTGKIRVENYIKIDNIQSGYGYRSVFGTNFSTEEYTKITSYVKLDKTGDPFLKFYPIDPMASYFDVSDLRKIDDDYERNIYMALCCKIIGNRCIEGGSQYYDPPEVWRA